MSTRDEKTETDAQSLITRLTQPVTVTLPGYAFVLMGLMVLALIVVAID